MKRILWNYLIFAIVMAGCTTHSADNQPKTAVPLDSLAPSMSYADAVRALVDSPAANGFMYHIAFYKSIEVDSLNHYAGVLDSLARTGSVGDNRHYIVSHRLLCSYLLSRADFDSVKAEALTLKPSLDLTQEEITCHVIAKALLATDSHTALDVQLRAVSAMRHGGVYRSAEVLSQAALICCNLGRYPTAMDYLNEAADTLARHGWPCRETIITLGNRATLYQTLEMVDSALSVNRQAITRAQSNPSLLADLLNNRAMIFARAGMRDSAYICFDSTLRVVNALEVPYSSMFLRHVKARRALLTIDDPKASGADLAQAVADLEAALHDKAGQWEEKFGVGVGMFKLGRPGAIPYMEQAHDSIALHLEPRILLWAKRHLIDAYIAVGEQKKASAEYVSAFALADTVDMRHARYLSIAGEMQYHIRQQARENQLLKKAHNTDRAKVFWLTLACVLGGALLVWAGAFIVLNLRFQRRRRLADSEQMTRLIENQKMLNRHIDELQNAGEGTIDWSRLTPSSMSAEDTARFRQSFMALYPTFLTRLREFCPGLTTGDETMCMLIKIGQNSSDIGLTLGISRASVNTARYRIRKKMALTKEQQLDDIIERL